MALPAQTNLLKVLDEGAVRRLGEKRATKVDVRLLVATNRDLDSLTAAGEFREDLYYRLSVVTLVVPPLRKRPEDIEPLARLFLAESVRRHRKPRILAPGTLELLVGYSYPGNIRELRYAIEHAGILSEDGVLRPEDFPFARARASGAGAAATSRRVRTRPIAQEITPERLAQVLREQGGNRVRAARALQISRATLYRLLDRSDRSRREAPNRTSPPVRSPSERVRETRRRAPPSVSASGWRLGQAAAGRNQRAIGEPGIRNRRGVNPATPGRPRSQMRRLTTVCLAFPAGRSSRTRP